VDGVRRRRGRREGGREGMENCTIGKKSRVFFLK
jgi:hypothetical protein